MPIDAGIYSQIDTSAPTRLAQMLDPNAIAQRRLVGEQQQDQLAQIERGRKLRDILQTAGTANPAEVAQTLGKAGYIDEASKYQQIAQAQKQAQDAEMTRRQGLMRQALGQAAALGGDPELHLRPALQSLGFVPPEQIENAVQQHKAMTPEQNKTSLLAGADPEYLPKLTIELAKEKAKADLASGKMPEGMRMGKNGPEWIPGYLQGRVQIAAAGAQAMGVPMQVVQTDQGPVQVPSKGKPGAPVIATPLTLQGGQVLRGAKSDSLTEAQGNATLFGARAQESDKILNDIGTNYNLLGLNAKKQVEGIPGIASAANAMLTPTQQKVDQAQRDFVNAVLRKESGASISPSEFNNAQKQYFPQPGDSAEVIAQKKANRATAIQGLKIMAGSGAAKMDAAQASPAGWLNLGKE